MLQNLVAELRRCEVSEAEIARILGHDETWFRDRIDGREEFTLSEMLALRTALGSEATLEYLAAT